MGVFMYLNISGYIFALSLFRLSLPSPSHVSGVKLTLHLSEKFQVLICSEML